MGSNQDSMLCIYQWDKSGMQSRAKKMARWLRAHIDPVNDLG